MSNETDFNDISFDMPKNQSNVIKVIGVGGGGSNAINHMFQQGINGVDFVICNTDAQALENSAVPIKIQLGVSLTEGLGAGANPEVGEKAAVESLEDIKAMLETNTKMVFITAGMGGGTGTGAAPVIAKMAKELDILTVGIVTVPFQFEGKMRNEQAQLGVEKLRRHVDSLVVINNNKLREVYGNLGFKAGFSKADEVLSTAARGIAEVITHHYTQNIDLRDAKTVLSNSGTAIMGSSNASGENRAQEAIIKALDSPLLNDNKITGAKNVLLLIVSGTEEITIDEIGEINDHIQSEAGNGANIIMGVGEDETLADAISVTIIATGFDIDQQNEITNTEAKKIIHSLEDEQEVVKNLTAETTEIAEFEVNDPIVLEETTTEEVSEEKIVHTLLDEEEEENAVQMEMDLIPTTDLIRDIDVVYEEVLAPAAVTSAIDDFIITPVSNESVTEIEVNEPEFVQEEDQFELRFDLPFSETKAEAETEGTSGEDEAPIVFDLTDDEIKEIEVKDAIEVIPVTEHTLDGVVKYSLENYMDMEDQLTEASVEKQEETLVEEELVFEKKIVEDTDTKTEEAPLEEGDVSPMNSSIEDILKNRADERRKKMKEFNYKFRNNSSKIDEIEKEPAYKRQGIDLDETQPSSEDSSSRMSLGTDSNDDIQLRSNNSFLHDNVD
ncbi:MAG: cell division protein FtsZ [Flavobacteriaceae bacterium]|nr:cell division protein FtsZ [Flavobacteriaceae bacterium]